MRRSLYTVLGVFALIVVLAWVIALSETVEDAITGLIYIVAERVEGVELWLSKNSS